MTPEKLAPVRGIYEERAARLMRGAELCSTATHVAVLEMGRTLDALSLQLYALTDRIAQLEAQPRPPVAREQMRLEAAVS